MKKLVIAALISLPLISYSQINEFGWLLGTWKLRNKDTYEVWKESGNKKLMEAISIRIKGVDTVLMERIMIRREGKIFFYAPDVADQPDLLFKIQPGQKIPTVHDRHVNVQKYKIRNLLGNRHKNISKFFQRLLCTSKT